MPGTNPNLKNLDKKQQHQWQTVYDKCLKNGDDEETSAKKAWGAVKSNKVRPVDLDSILSDFVKEVDIQTNDYDKIRSYIQQNCQRFVQAVNHGTCPLIYRGMKKRIDRPYILKPIERISKNEEKDLGGFGFYNYFMINNPEFKDFPNRLKSFICTTSSQLANEYGAVYAVIPSDNSKIAVYNAEDIWTVQVGEISLISFTKGFNVFAFYFCGKNPEEMRSYPQIMKFLEEHQNEFEVLKKVSDELRAGFSDRPLSPRKLLIQNNFKYMNQLKNKILTDEMIKIQLYKMFQYCSWDKIDGSLVEYVKENMSSDKFGMVLNESLTNYQTNEDNYDSSNEIAIEGECVFLYFNDENMKFLLEIFPFKSKEESQDNEVDRILSSIENNLEIIAGDGYSYMIYENNQLKEISFNDIHDGILSGKYRMPDIMKFETQLKFIESYLKYITKVKPQKEIKSILTNIDDFPIGNTDKIYLYPIKEINYGKLSEPVRSKIKSFKKDILEV